MADLTPVQEFYKDKTIFITGASGFMGKVLIEKLLYSCSELKEVIMLMRPKKGKVPETRLEEMFRLPIFQRIKDEKPHVLKKLSIVQGDVTFDSLGLSGETLKRVTEETAIVFHMAATLRLEGNLKDAIQMNTTGTKRVLDVAKKMKKLVALIHLSTAFCNCDQEVMYEKVYDFPHDPEDLIRCAEWMDVKTLENITPNLLKPHPNTYTYSKRLAEILVRNHYPELPVVITRPSIVSPSAFEPVAGWVDNLNGPTGLMLGAAKGVIRSMLIDVTLKCEVIPVDYAINGLITIAYETAVYQEKLEEIPVYNITIPERKKLTWKAVLDMGKKIGYQYPCEMGVWYPNGCVTTSKFIHLINVIFFQWLPAYFIDFFLLCTRRKPFMIRVQNRIATGLNVLQFFTTHSWIFKSDNYEQLFLNLGPKDKKIFNMDMDAEDDHEYLKWSILGGRLYIMKEPLSTLPRARRQLRIFYLIDLLAKLIVGSVLVYFVSSRLTWFSWAGNYLIVSPAAFEPLPGWVDNLNGPTGLMIGAAKGVIRSMLCDGRYRSEVIPVDYAINGLIVVPYETATAKEKPKQIPVYNITCAEKKKITWETVMNLGKKIGYEYPFEAGVWYPDGNITTSKVYHTINVVLFHWLPAYLIDFLLLCFGQKRFMVRVQNRISTGLEVLQFFTTRPWDFKSENYEKLYLNLNEREKKIFNMDMDIIDDEEYLKIGILGGRQYIMKEPLSTLPKARNQLKALYVLDRVTKALIFGFVLYYILSRTGLLDIILQSFGISTK